MHCMLGTLALGVRRKTRQPMYACRLQPQHHHVVTAQSVTCASSHHPTSQSFCPTPGGACAGSHAAPIPLTSPAGGPPAQPGRSDGLRVSGHPQGRCLGPSGSCPPLLVTACCMAASRWAQWCKDSGCGGCCAEYCICPACCCLGDVSIPVTRLLLCAVKHVVRRE